jgi:hypothetical protein
MVEMTVQLPDKLAERCKAVGPWLPTVIELSLSGFKTSAIKTVSEVIKFLCENPDPNEVSEFHVSEEAQLRLRRLLTLNEGGHLSLSENSELDELQHLEHIMIMLKIHARELHCEGNN